MADRVYKEDLPAIKVKLEKLRDEFLKIQAKTDWVSLRIDPLLQHVRTLEALLNSSEFATEFSRLRKGVTFFHSDLVYFRTNIQGLEKILHSEKSYQGTRKK